MRVIAGSKRGRPLKVPRGNEVRPTLERTREALFNILGPRLQGARFLDLFAGTGANGIEALSRGAAHALFVDSDRRAIAVVRENLARTGLGERAAIRRLNLPPQLAKIQGPFDLVFADPPYTFEHHDALLAGLGAHGLVAEGGLVVLEHGKTPAPAPIVAPFEQVRQQHYGDTWLSFYA